MSGPGPANSAKIVIAKSSIRNASSTGLATYAGTAASVTDSQFVNDATAITATSNIAAAKGIITVNNCMISGSSWLCAAIGG